MASLANQNISTSFPQLIKIYGGTVGSSLGTLASGDEAGISALQISTTGVKSSGTFAVDGAATFGSSITASTGTATIGTISVNTATIGTLSTLNGLSVTTTATVGTLSVSNGASVSTTATIGTAKIGASGPSITKLSYGTAAFTSATVSQYNAADSTTGTFALTGAALGDIVYGSINSLGSATGTYNLSLSFYPVGTDIVRYSIQNQGSTNGTIPAGVIYATAMRFTA